MTSTIIMPQLGETVAEGKILAWFKSVGDEIKEGDNLFEVETDKVTIEVQAIVAGRLSEIRVGAGVDREGRRGGRGRRRWRDGGGGARRSARDEGRAVALALRRGVDADRQIWARQGRTAFSLTPARPSADCAARARHRRARSGSRATRRKEDRRGSRARGAGGAFGSTRAAARPSRDGVDVMRRRSLGRTTSSR